MKNIVFIDHDIENYHADTFAALLKEMGGEFRLAGVFANRKDNLQEWAARNGVAAFDRVEDLATVADFVMVLAPSNPETHLDLCRKAFRLKKPTYVDKTFAPDVSTAEAIFAEADLQGVLVQTSSVLRYTEVQRYVSEGAGRAPRYVSTWASGGNFEEYIIHPVEHVVSLLGGDVLKVTQRELAGFTRIDLSFAGDRAATINMHVGHNTPFLSIVHTDVETLPIKVDGSDLFRSGLNGILDFFRNPEKRIDRKETLAVMGVLEMLRPKAAPVLDMV